MEPNELIENINEVLKRSADLLSKEQHSDLRNQLLNGVELYYRNQVNRQVQRIVDGVTY